MAGMGVEEPPLWPLGWSSHPKKAKRKKKKKNWVRFFGWPDHPKAMGWFGHPIPAMGGGRDNGFEPLCDFFVDFVQVEFGDA
jgi:hypothetical protein